VGHIAVATADELAAALAAAPCGLRLVEVRTDRAANAALHRRIQAAAAAALA
jgi:2-succinyl-5-enolpyruvyl-6-hydroxy-3-cyclohexene-1-carboxylate synthase